MTTAEPITLDLQRAAREHLWLHFTRMSAYEGAEVPIIVRGDGCYLEDMNGKRYLDALAGLFSVNIGYGYGEEMGEAAAAQMRELPFYTNWSYAHPRAIELASETPSRPAIARKDSRPFSCRASMIPWSSASVRLGALTAPRRRSRTACAG